MGSFVGRYGCQYILAAIYKDSNGKYYTATNCGIGGYSNIESIKELVIKNNIIEVVIKTQPMFDESWKYYPSIDKHKYYMLVDGILRERNEYLKSSLKNLEM